MKALVVENGSTRFVSDYARPAPGPAEALVRVLLAGICATDLEIVKGYAAFTGVLGHEFVGRVEAVAGDAEQSWIGRRVVGEINLGCGACPTCLGEGPAHCPSRRVLGIRAKDGAFADYLTLPLTNLRPVPAAVPDEEAVFTEPLAAAVRIREQVSVRPSARVAVLGPGRLGLLCGQVLALAGSEVTMLGRRPASLVTAQTLGLEAALAAEQTDRSFDLVVDTTGNENGLATALRLVRPQGTLVMKSTFAAKVNVDLSPLVVDEVRVVGSRCGPFSPALRLLARKQVQVTPLINACYPLSEAEAALAQAAQPGVRKILLAIGSPVDGWEAAG